MSPHDTSKKETSKSRDLTLTLCELTLPSPDQSQDLVRPGQCLMMAGSAA